MATNRGNVNPRPEIGTPFGQPGAQNAKPAVLLFLIHAPGPAVFQHIPAVDQTTPAAMLLTIGASRPVSFS